jgi:hypothetical protein
MSGLWFGLTTVAIGLVIRWYILAEAKLSRPADRSNTERKK